MLTHMTTHGPQACPRRRHRLWRFRPQRGGSQRLERQERQAARCVSGIGIEGNDRGDQQRAAAHHRRPFGRGPRLQHYPDGSGSPVDRRHQPRLSVGPVGIRRGEQAQLLGRPCAKTCKLESARGCRFIHETANRRTPKSAFPALCRKGASFLPRWPWREKSEHIRASICITLKNPPLPAGFS